MELRCQTISVSEVDVIDNLQHIFREGLVKLRSQRHPKMTEIKTYPNPRSFADTPREVCEHPVLEHICEGMKFKGDLRDIREAGSNSPLIETGEKDVGG